jgi:predicted MPP superfamily phosphohydrolase
MLDRVSSSPRRVRTLFLSDIHLGTRGCQADKLLDLLRCYEADTIYLVGDIVDGWQLKSSWYWPQLHNDVVQKLLRQARKGVRLFYIPGNHDEFLRDYYGTHFGGIEVLEDTIHVAAEPPRSRRPLRRDHSPRALARALGQQCLRSRDLGQHVFQ